MGLACHRLGRVGSTHAIDAIGTLVRRTPHSIARCAAWGGTRTIFSGMPQAPCNLLRGSAHSKQDNQPGHVRSDREPQDGCPKPPRPAGSRERQKESEQ